MESHVERFLEQRLEQFADHGSDNHFDQHSDPNNRGGFPRCEVTMNNQGGDKLHFNGYSYSKKAISANAIRWTCATPTRCETRCKGAITTDRERPYHNPRSLVEHNHPPEDSEASIMRDIARAKRRMRRRTYPHPFPFYPWMLPLQQMQEQSGGRDDTNALQATLGMGAVGGPMDTSEAGPSGFGEDFRVKMEPEWVDAGALEPNCELEGQYDDAPDYGMGYGNNSMTGQDDQNYHHQMFSGQQQQPLPLIPDSQDPVKLRVPGKPNLTITVAQNRQGSSQSNAPLPQPPLHLLNPLLRPKRGRPRGSAYGSYNESEDRVTTILTDTIIASRELEKLGAAAYHTPRVTAAMSSPLQNRVKPRSKDPEAVKAADIVNKAQNRSGPNVTQELEKVHLKLRQEVLALEVQNLKAEREKLKVYRRNVAIRREIMMLHLQLGKGIPSECASSGRGLETVDSCSSFMDAGFDNDPPDSVSKEQVSLSKRLPDVSISRSAASQSPKISVRKSLQTSNSSPNISPLSCSSSLKDSTPPPPSVTKGRLEASEQLSGNREPEDPRPSGEGLLDGDAKRNSDVSRLQAADSPVSSGSGPPDNQAGNKKFSEHNDVHRSDGDYATKSSLQQSGSVNDPGKEELVPLDSVSSDLSIEMLSEPGSSQWTNQSSAPMTEHESFDDLHFEGDDSYDNTDEIGEFSGGPASKEPPDSQSQYGSYSDDSAPKRRRVENMWEPDDTPL